MILSVEDFSCRYGTRKKDTLSHVSLRVEEGEMVLIAGRSGCGKSTLIKAITGLLEDVSCQGRICPLRPGYLIHDSRGYRSLCRHRVPDSG